MLPRCASIISAFKILKSKVKVVLCFGALATVIYFTSVKSLGTRLAFLQILGLRMRDNHMFLTWDSPRGSNERHWYSLLTDNLRLLTSDEEITQDGGEKFQPINGYEAWVYSAFFDIINEKNFIRIFGFQKIDLKHQVYCHVTKGHKVTLLKGTKEFLPDGHNLSFCATSYVCLLDAHTGSNPSHVALTFNDKDTPTNQLQVSYPRKRLRNFTVCHAALFQFKSPAQLVQSIEINRVLGAQYFYVYNISVSNTTDAVLRYYEKLGLLTVMQWQLPQQQVWYRAQNLAINDCVYRNRLVSQYVVIQDTDEFIVPNRHSSWGELIEEIVRNTNSKDGIPSPTIGSFSVETTFHCGKPNQSQWDEVKEEYPMTSEEEQFYRNHSIFALLNVLRVRRVMRFNKYCKTIVRPELTLYAGIHFTHAHRDSSTHTVVRNDLAIVHHYKDRFKPEMVDTTILQFKNVIYPKLKAAYRELAFI